MIFDFNSPVSSWIDFCDCLAVTLGWNSEPRTDPQKRDARLRDDGGERVPPDHESHPGGLREQRHPEGGAAQSDVKRDSNQSFLVERLW